MGSQKLDQCVQPAKMSVLVCSIVDAAMDNTEVFEVISTEEMLATLDLVNQKWEENQNTPRPEEITFSMPVQGCVEIQ